MVPPARGRGRRLEPSETITRCPYKGTASYYSVAGVEDGKDLVWYYPEPFAETVRIAGLLCFFNERVDISLDGEPAQRPESPWSHGVKGEASRTPRRRRPAAER